MNHLMETVQFDFDINAIPRDVALAWYKQQFTFETMYDMDPTDENLRKTIIAKFTKAKGQGIMDAIRGRARKIADKQFRRGDYDKIDGIKDLKSREFDKLTPIVWLTVNSKPDISLQQLMQKVNNFVKQKYIIRAMWCFEQTSKTIEEMGKHKHAHILLEHNLQFASDWKRRIYAAFGSICDLKCKAAESILKWKPCLKPNDDKKRVKYIRGVKKSIEKQPMLLVDSRWRQNEGIKPFYHKGKGNGWLSLEDTSGEGLTRGGTPLSETESLTDLSDLSELSSDDEDL